MELLEGILGIRTALGENGPVGGRTNGDEGEGGRPGCIAGGANECCSGMEGGLPGFTP